MKQNQFRTSYNAKSGQIIIFNKINKMTYNFFAFDIISAPLFCQHDIMTMPTLRDMKKVTFMGMIVKNG